jgi:hypothetical protein
MKKLFFAFLIFLSGLSLFLLDVNAKLPAEEKLIQKIKEILTPVTSAPKNYPADFHPICATPAFVWLPAHRRELSPEAQQELSALMPDRPTYSTTEKTYDTPGGHFRVHYVTSTVDSVYKSSVDTSPADGHPDYVNFVGAVIDSMWRKEVDTLGYYSPPSDGWYTPNGGNGRYDVYLKSMAFGSLGYTEPEYYAPPDYIGATSFIVLRNDYSVYAGYRPDFNDYLRVTSAHEFFHAIQFGYDVEEFEYVPSDPITPIRPYWMELTAVWMEDVVYDSINDYLNYLRFFYNYPWFSLKTFSDTLINKTPADTARYFHAYASCVWAFYLSEKFGADAIKNIWTLCADVQGDNILSATDDVLLTKGSSFDQGFSEFSIWNYFTNYRADIVNYYSEGNLYPVVATQPHSSYPVNISSVPYPPEVLGTNYVRFVTQATTGGLSLDFNGVDSANWITSLIGYSSADPDTFAEFTLDSLKRGNFKFHNWNDYDYIIMIPAVVTKTTGSFDYSYSAIYDSTLTKVEEEPGLMPGSFTLSQNYPNPFNPTTTIPFTVYGSKFIVHRPIHTTLNIYNIRGQLVKTLVDEEKLPGDYSVIWNGQDNDDKAVSSGIYFYQIRSDNSTITKKMVLLR